MWKFGPLPLPQPAGIDNEHSTAQKCFAFMLPLAKLYADDSIRDVADLEQEKERRQREQGIPILGKVPPEYTLQVAEQKTERRDEDRAPRDPHDHGVRADDDRAR